MITCNTSIKTETNTFKPIMYSPAGISADDHSIRTPSPIRSVSSGSPDIESGHIECKIKYFDPGMKLPYEERNYIDGLMHGLYKRWFSNGKLCEVISYERNIMNGSHICYYENGAKQFEFNYVNGLRHGLQTMYYPSGGFCSIQTYNMGILVGKHTTFYENGNKKKMITCNSVGKLEGSWRTWYKNGNIHIDTSYRNDKLQGIYFKYASDGKLLYSFIYDEGNPMALAQI
jgi:antitoxin component YwqK of YwqJK toxin-antitoxin module